MSQGLPSSLKQLPRLVIGLTTPVICICILFTYAPSILTTRNIFHIYPQLPPLTHTHKLPS